MMQDLTVRDLDRHVAQRRAKVSNASVNREITLLRRVVRWAAGLRLMISKDRRSECGPVPLLALRARQ